MKQPNNIIRIETDYCTVSILKQKLEIAMDYLKKFYDHSLNDKKSKKHFLKVKIYVLNENEIILFFNCKTELVLNYSSSGVVIDENVNININENIDFNKIYSEIDLNNSNIFNITVNFIDFYNAFKRSFNLNCGDYKFTIKDNKVSFKTKKELERKKCRLILREKQRIQKEKNIKIEEFIKKAEFFKENSLYIFDHVMPYMHLIYKNNNLKRLKLLEEYHNEMLKKELNLFIQFDVDLNIKLFHENIFYIGINKIETNVKVIKKLEQQKFDILLKQLTLYENFYREFVNVKLDLINEKVYKKFNNIFKQ